MAELEAARFRASRLDLVHEDVTRAFRVSRRGGWTPAAFVVAELSAIIGDRVTAFFAEVSEFEAKQVRFLRTTSFGITVGVSDTVDPEAKDWVRHRWLDAWGFPVIVDADTREIVYRDRLTFFGAVDSVIKRRLVRRYVVPAVVGFSQAP